jgi:hypothetical protein
MMKEKFFVVILGLMAHNRMGKTCAPKMFGFLRHPSPYPSDSEHNLSSKVLLWIRRIEKPVFQYVWASPQIFPRACGHLQKSFSPPRYTA